MVSIHFLLLALSLLVQPQEAPSLDSVLKKMDDTAATFRSAQADFEWDQYQKVVDDIDIQKGTVYYRRAGNEIEMMAEIKQPDTKFVLYKEGKLQIYQPKIEQVMVFSAGSNRNEMESYLVLGFGGGGHALANSYDIAYAGSEQVEGVTAAKLALTPKSQRVHNMFQTITLWIDPARGIPVQQRFDEPSGDYRITKYSDIRINQKLPNDAFKLKTNGKTKFVKPNG